MYRDGEISGSAGVGHNMGPPLVPKWQLHCWTKAHKEAWKNPPIEIVRMRIRRAKALGISYRELTSIILDTGRYPTGGTDDAE